MHAAATPTLRVQRWLRCHACSDDRGAVQARGRRRHTCSGDSAMKAAMPMWQRHQQCWQRCAANNSGAAQTAAAALYKQRCWQRCAGSDSDAVKAT
eukprot:262372-Pleurochrysis_carterae.AAC.1